MSRNSTANGNDFIELDSLPVLNADSAHVNQKRKDVVTFLCVSIDSGNNCQVFVVH